MEINKRYFLAQDDSCHWLLIPLEKRDRFYELLNKGEEAEDEFNTEFWEKYSTGGGAEVYSFTNPEIIK